MAKLTDNDIIEKERQNDYEINRIDRFMYRSLYFTDSGIIGAKGFVSRKHLVIVHRIVHVMLKGLKAFHILQKVHIYFIGMIYG